MCFSMVDSHNPKLKVSFKIRIDFIEDYVCLWAKHEVNYELDTLSEWVMAVRSLIRIHKLKRSMNLYAESA